MSTLSGPALRAEKLSLTLGRSVILDSMSFDITAGNIHCFIGPNGGGKTSAIRTLLGQMPHEGKVFIDWPHDSNRVIGYIPQLIELERSLPLTVENFMAIVSQDKPAFTSIKKALLPKIDEVLEKVGLLDKRRFMIGSLSGGERQRLLFAQALLPTPSLLVLDEPMTSMDEGGVLIFENLVKDLHAEGATILWVNHDLEQVNRMADSISVIDHGIIAHGPVDSTLTEDMMKGLFRPTKVPAAKEEC